ncbi:serine/threonine protein kinase, partial [Myxococcota bacterium]|nr:serine/threonine protein kinase [Myxococcota bacterium]
MSKQPEDPRSADAPTIVRHLSETSGAHRLGTVLGHQYELVEVIGEGGIGIVYRARQRTVDRDVAIKVLKKEFANDELAVLRFENEASAIGRLRHPNTLRLYDCQRTADGDLYIVTELLSGAPLSEVLKKEGRLTAERALRLFDEVCRSLAEAHAAGIVHRDLKPANVFLDHIGREDLVKVLDFGIAKILQASAITRAGVAPGTPHYMAPEQATAQKIDHRADIYALGVILFQMIAGRPPFDGATAMEILKKHITEPVPSFAETAPEILVPAELERFVAWMLEKQPQDRPASVEVLRKHIPGLLAIA